MSFSEVKYLLAIFNYKKNYFESISLKDLSDLLNVKASSAFEMLKKLEEKKLLIYNKFSGIRLTSKGLTEASLFMFRFFYLSKSIKTTLDLRDVDLNYEDFCSLIITNIFDLAISNLASPQIKKTKNSFVDVKKKESINLFDNAKLAYFFDIKEGFSGYVNFINYSIEGLEEACSKRGLIIGSYITVNKKFSFDNSYEILLNNKEILISSKMIEGIILSTTEYELLKKKSLETDSLGESITPQVISKELKKKIINLNEGKPKEKLCIESFENVISIESDFLQKKSIVLNSLVEILEIYSFDESIEIKTERGNIISLSKSLSSKIKCSKVS